MRRSNETEVECRVSLFDDLKLAEVDTTNYSTRDLFNLYIKYIELLERKVDADIENLKCATGANVELYNQLHLELDDLKETLNIVKENLKDIIHKMEINQIQTDNEQTLLIKNIEWKMVALGGGSSGITLIVLEVIKYLIPILLGHVTIS